MIVSMSGRLFCVCVLFSVGVVVCVSLSLSLSLSLVPLIGWPTVFEVRACCVVTGIDSVLKT